MKHLIFSFLFFITSHLSGQEYSTTTRYIAGTFHTQNTTINGFSFGALPKKNDEQRFVRTNGIRTEIPGIGFFLFFVGSPITYVDTLPDNFNANDYPFDEIVNGINISIGSHGNLNYNGLTVAAVAQYGILNNGIAIAGLMNAMDQSNGVQIALWYNEALVKNGLQIAASNNAVVGNGVQIGLFNYVKTFRGVQIGLINETKKSKGIQIGLWNKNEERYSLFFNWNF